MAQPIEINSLRGQRPDQWKAGTGFTGDEQQRVDSYMVYDPDRKAQLLRAAIPREMTFDFSAHPGVDPNSRRPPEVRPTPRREMRTNRVALIRLLANCPDPDTGTHYTQAKLAEILGVHETTINQHLRDAGMDTHFVPEAKTGVLPENEEAFFKGMAMGDFQVRTTHRRTGDFVIVGTRGSDRMKDLLIRTLGTRGSLGGKEALKEIYLDREQFGFFEEKPQIDARFLDAKGRFAPFLLGLLAVRLSERGNRLVIPNSNGLVRNIHKKYVNHFGETMGSLKNQLRPHLNGNTNGKDARQDLIIVQNPGIVVATLAQVPAVQALPFFRTLGEIK